MDELNILSLPELTTPEEGFDIAVEGMINGSVGKKDKLANKNEFNAIVLGKVRPTPFSAPEISAMFGAKITIDDPKAEYYGYRVRITDIDNPHGFYPLPCSMNEKPTPVNKVIIGMHTLILTMEELTNSDTCIIRLSKAGGRYELGYGYFVSKTGRDEDFYNRFKLKNPYIADACSPSGDLFKASVRGVSLITKALGTGAGGLSIWGEVTPTSPYGLPDGGPQNPGGHPNWSGVTIHYTVTFDAKGTVDVLGKRTHGLIDPRKGPDPVSYHYVIDKDGTVHELIKPTNRAIHGGHENSDQIGIGLVNLGYDVANAGKSGAPPASSWYKTPHPLKKGMELWEPYPSPQIDALNKLIKDLKTAYPTIKEVSGHEDYSGTKYDPGPAFDVHMEKLIKTHALRRGHHATTKNREAVPEKVVTGGTSDSTTGVYL